MLDSQLDILNKEVQVLESSPLPMDWLRRIDQIWGGKDGFVVSLIDAPDEVFKLLFNSELAKLFNLKDIAQELNLGLSLSSLEEGFNAANNESPIQRLGAQLLLNKILIGHPYLSSVPILGSLIIDNNLVGYRMPLIRDYSAVCINSQPFLKNQVLLLESHFPVYLDKQGRNAFDLGHNKYMLIDASYN